MPDYLAGQGYHVEVLPVNGQFYWHAWMGSEHVNGGLGESEEDAGRTAVRACGLDITHRKMSMR